MASSVAKNDPCPCGSEKRYKDCCGREAALEAAQRRNKIIAVGLAMSAAIGFFIYMNVKDQEGVVEMPAGSVFDEEHGHYHNAEGTELHIPGWFWSAGQSKWVKLKDGAPGLFRQPDGDVPPGKTWSPEHGHWHDIADGLPGEEVVLTPQPPGEVPEGKVWSLEHGHWHDAK